MTHMSTGPIMRRRAAWVVALSTSACSLFACFAQAALDRPRSVADAVELLHRRLSVDERRELAYLRKDELIRQQHGFAMTVRNQFGMWGDNPALLASCKSRNAEDCSMEIIERLYARLRAELPAEELQHLETLESRMARVQLPAHEFAAVPLSGFVTFLQSQIDAQLPEGDRFTVHYASGDAQETVTTSILAGSTLVSVLDGLAFASFDVVKVPPDLLIEPYYRPLAGVSADGKLQSVFNSAQGLREETRELARDPAAFEKLWGRLLEDSKSTQPAPQIDFARFSALMIALGGRPTDGYELSLIAAGLHHRTAVLVVEESQPGKGCKTATAVSYPTAVFLLPKEAESVSFLERFTTHECAPR